MQTIKNSFEFGYFFHTSNPVIFEDKQLKTVEINWKRLKTVDYYWKQLKTGKTVTIFENGWTSNFCLFQPLPSYSSLFSILAFQHFSTSVFSYFSISVFHYFNIYHFSILAFQHFSILTFQHFSNPQFHHLPAYSSKCQPIQAYFSLFPLIPAFSSVFQPIPA